MGDSAGNSGDLPFKEPVDASELNLAPDPTGGDEVQTAEIAKSPASVVEAPSSMQSEDHGDELSVSHLIQQLSLGLDSLKQLNLQGFKQIYPIFLVVFGSVILGLLLSFVATFLSSMNHLPIFGGLFQGVSELVGLVVVVRFITSNLLLQHRRAEVFARIALLKKDLLGGQE
ncbi:hypothetical protein SynBIOSE41_01634 [Synechococcus sp. BIOS-E4-1]|uniref:CAAD domain-containing protein n=1 Tax=Synechococcus sp. BIOS-E4-1 TaxID=1400864 RepID=UPI0016466D7A|nr:CAAD domain-containing protein [Synechococcus sp. BIOS-E4-1]QNI54148.1 hypothetical protein SynBIOSE41_01634 [Synechococcus sp. BIOS-E4-1]